MKILFCTTGFEDQYEGPSVFIHALYQHAIKNKVNTYTLHILTENISKDYVGVYGVPVKINWPFNKIGMLSRAWFYYRALNTISTQYPFTHLVFSDPIPGCLSILMNRNKAKTICFLNDDDNIFPKAQKTLKKKLVRHLYASIQKRVLAKTKLVITNSQYLTQLLHERNIRNTAILKKGVDTQLFSFCPPREIDLKQTIKILFIKKDYERGGLFILLEALQMIRTFRFKLTIVGPPKMVYHQIKARYKSSNLTIAHWEQLKRKEVAAQMKDHDLFCVPSTREALGVANLEALASGLPVISTTTGGIPEALKNGEVAWLCAPGNPSGLQATIMECLEAPEKRKQKVKSGRKWVEAQFSLEQVCEKFLHLIR